MSFFEDPPLHDFPDRAVRLLQAYPAHLRELVQDVSPRLAPRLAFDRAQPLVRDFALPDWRRRESDLLFHVPFLPGEGLTELLICLLVEHQSAIDPAMPLRTLWYAVLYWERQWLAWSKNHARGEPLRLNPVLPIVLHTGTERWTAPCQMLDLMAGPEELHRFVPQWQPLLWDLAERTPQELLGLTGDWLPSLAVVRGEAESAEAFEAVYRAVLERLEPLSEREETRWRDLVWFVLSWALRRRPQTEQQSLYTAAVQSHERAGAQKEVTIMSGRVGMTWEDEMLQRGELRGRIAGARTTLLRMGRKRFGEPDAATVAALEAVTDFDRLEQLGERLLDVASWQELLAAP